MQTSKPLLSGFESPNLFMSFPHTFFKASLINVFEAPSIFAVP